MEGGNCVWIGCDCQDAVFFTCYWNIWVFKTLTLYVTLHGYTQYLEKPVKWRMVNSRHVTV